MTAEEYEAAFHGIELPYKVELFPGVSVTDVPEFVKKEIAILRTNNKDRVLDPIRYRLDRLLEIVNQANENE